MPLPLLSVSAPLTRFAAVAIVDDDEVICDELQRVLDQHEQTACVCVCHTMQAALKRIPVSAPDVVLMDISLPDGPGTACARQLKQAMPGLHVVMYSMREDDDAVLDAVSAGAAGYLLKTASPEEVLRAIGAAIEGNASISPLIAGKLLRSFAAPRETAAPDAAVGSLTLREREILELCSAGLLPKQVASDLDIALGTVNSHLKHIYEKLHVRSRIEAVIRYLRR